MSVVVWDGTVLASDCQVTQVGCRFKSRKLYRVGDALVGLVGPTDFAATFLEWFKTGADPATYPANQKDANDWVAALVITPERKVLKYERAPHPFDLTDNPHVAMGSGRDYALGALACGAGARRAVEVACQYDVDCGLGVDALTFNKEEL